MYTEDMHCGPIMSQSLYPLADVHQCLPKTLNSLDGITYAHPAVWLVALHTVTVVEHLASSWALF